jgi:hypothetical protein
MMSARRDWRRKPARGRVVIFHSTSSAVGRDDLAHHPGQASERVVPCRVATEGVCPTRASACRVASVNIVRHQEVIGVAAWRRGVRRRARARGRDTHELAPGRPAVVSGSGSENAKPVPSMRAHLGKIVRGRWAFRAGRPRPERGVPARACDRVETRPGVECCTTRAR